MLISWDRACQRLTCLTRQGSRPQPVAFDYSSPPTCRKTLLRVNGLLQEAALVPMDRLWIIFQSIIYGSVEVVLHIFPFHAAAWHASAKSIDSLLNESSADTKKSSTILWRDSTQSQLTVVAITVQYIGDFPSLPSAEQIHLPPRQP